MGSLELHKPLILSWICEEMKCLIKKGELSGNVIRSLLFGESHYWTDKKAGIGSRERENGLLSSK